MGRKLWHLLHLMKGGEDVDCRRCKKSILGIPTYKCLDCNFRVHESCGKEPNRGMEVRHKLREIHHVIFIELGKHGEEEAVCSFCETRLLHSSGKNGSIIYKCVIPECKFLTHESCIEQPVMMVDYSHNSQHTLFLNPPKDYWWDLGSSCFVCGKDILNSSFFYRCNKCPCDIHISCATGWKNKANQCNPHENIAIWKPIDFTCDICGKKGNDMGSQCSKCGLLFHTECTRFICNLRETGHQHPITFTLSLSQGKHNVCQACGWKVNTNYGAYCCEEGCEYVFHPFCGYSIEQQGGTNDPYDCPPYLVGWINDV